MIWVFHGPFFKHLFFFLLLVDHCLQSLSSISGFLVLWRNWMIPAFGCMEVISTSLLTSVTTRIVPGNWSWLSYLYGMLLWICYLSQLLTHPSCAITLWFDVHNTFFASKQNYETSRSLSSSWPDSLPGHQDYIPESPNKTTPCKRLNEAIRWRWSNLRKVYTRIWAIILELSMQLMLAG